MCAPRFEHRVIMTRSRLRKSYANLGKPWTLVEAMDKKSRSGASGLLDHGLHTKRAYKLLMFLFHSQRSTVRARRGTS